jgi:hypothetical protein
MLAPAEKTFRQQVDDWLYEKTGGTVLSGPFKGMWLPREQAWTSGCLSPMLLGTHEQELHGAIENEIGRLSHIPYANIVNVGCAEGYYAVGLAMRTSYARVCAIDTDEECLRITNSAARKNNVFNVYVRTDLENAFYNPDLVVMDCEGAEVDYLNPEKYPGLLSATIIVEIHGGGADVVLPDRFRASHHITAYREGPRDPNTFDILRDMTSFFRWMTVCENRPCMMYWYVMVPR